MGLIQNIIAKLRKKKEESEDYSRRQKMMEQFETKKLSSNERELLRFQNEEREKRIKSKLGKYRKIENDEVWHGRKTNPVFAPNVTKGNKELFKNNKNIFTGCQQIFKQPDLFFGGQR